MEVTQTIKPEDRAAWRAWLEQNHSASKEIWLIFDDRPEVPSVPYLDAVEEALCFGWIDSLQKRISGYERAQRFSPRKRRSNWTELNKERARRLIRLGLMAPAGYAALPDLEAPFTVAEDILQALKAEPPAWANFASFPHLYIRVRIANIEEARQDPDEFERRLRKFMDKTLRNQMYGSWNDNGRLG